MPIRGLFRKAGIHWRASFRPPRAYCGRNTLACTEMPPIGTNNYFNLKMIEFPLSIIAVF
jgi:hypothetical protein